MRRISSDEEGVVPSDASTYVRWFAAATVLLLLGALVIAISALSYYYSGSKRLIDVRELPDDVRSGAVADFFHRYETDDDLIVVLGDSQPFGFRVAETSTSAYRLEKISGQSVINAAFQDCRPTDLLAEIRALPQAGLRPRSIVFNVTAPHASDPTFQRLGSPVSWIEFRLLGALHVVALLKSLEFTRTLGFDDQQVSASTTMDPPDDYFANLDNATYWALIDEVLKAAARTSSATIVYSTPFAPRALQITHAQQRLEAFNSRFLRHCEQHENVVCFAPQSQFQDVDFADIVHLNRRGHDKLATLLAERLSRH